MYSTCWVLIERNPKPVSQALSINIALVVYCKLLDFEVWVGFQLGEETVWEKSLEVKKNKVRLEEWEIMSTGGS